MKNFRKDLLGRKLEKAIIRREVYRVEKSVIEKFDSDESDGRMNPFDSSNSDDSSVEAQTGSRLKKFSIVNATCTSNETKKSDLNLKKIKNSRPALVCETTCSGTQVMKTEKINKSIHTNMLLHAAANAYFECNENPEITSSTDESSDVILSVGGEREDSRISEELRCLDELSSRCELASVAELIDDHFSLLVLPELAGAVPGFGFDLLGGKAKLSLNGSIKLPDFNRLFATAWADRSFFHGCTESYCRRPTTIYERRLLSDAAHRRSSALPSKTNTCENQCLGDSGDGDKHLLSNGNSEDFLLPCHNSAASFPSLARSASSWAIEGGFDSEICALDALLNFKRYSRSKKLFSFKLDQLFPDEAACAAI
eukprot:CAMPEP_0172438206 /NCGR_PEP_ID=MMETSP1064-20121228/72678_1 /TAXON_ID=202472 /ORGANISM="Aulacoseira subarctica , Strain CCAP 1002/5" /LENGTH=368 /DNA_ID=CAMNT_0013186749 /DNA_START=872 /DNA_END=1979 /DNA_ORIENTATION=+